MLCRRWHWFRVFSTSPSPRVRYAPSPTGYLHLGGLRTALFNYLFAKQSLGKFLVRVEDTDQTRLVPNAIPNLLNSLAWAGVDPDESPIHGGPVGPYIQSERLKLYQRAAQQLVDQQHAYHCFCTPERLTQLRTTQLKRDGKTKYDRACRHLSATEVQERLQSQPSTIRLRAPLTGTTTLKDLVRGYVQFQNETIEDQVLLKSDGYPTYHLANVVDDHAMGVTHVLRGEEWLTSTPKHILLYQALGYSLPQFAHLGLLLNSDRSKLSKRQGDVAVEDYQENYLPSALRNFVALLGWNPGTTTELFYSMESLVQAFQLEQINKSGSIVNLDRLNWMNQQHIIHFLSCPYSKEHSEQQYILQHVTRKLQQLEIVVENEATLYQYLSLIKSKVSKLDEFIPLCRPLYQAPNYEAPEAMRMHSKYWQSTTTSQLTFLAERLQQVTPFEEKPLMSCLKQFQKEYQLSMKQLLMPLRYCLTGMEVGAGIGPLMEILGKAETLNRLQGILTLK